LPDEPADHVKSVVLPAPFGPIKTRAPGSIFVDSTHGPKAAEVLRQVFNRETWHRKLLLDDLTPDG
jgi:hypothetical protein